MRVGRVYDEPAPDEGLRVLVDRLWPRGMRKDEARIDLWAKDVAPSTELRRWYAHDPAKSPEFAMRYRKELESEPAAAALEDLVATARDGDVMLLTATKDLELSQAHVLGDLIADSIS
ncbi:MAG TPA: DUF488 family protein [Intrasporangium sp.]|nr:DUF488 family protein [Intrasporangium sp.]